MPFHWSGGGTSNIKMSSVWCASIPSISTSRTAFAQSSITVRISVSFERSAIVLLLYIHGLIANPETSEPVWGAHVPEQHYGYPNAGFADPSRDSGFARPEQRDQPRHRLQVLLRNGHEPGA